MKGMLISITLVLMVFAVLILRPVPIVSEDQALTATGTVAYIFEGGEKDVVFRLQESDRLFYINRGLESGLELDQLKSKLVGNEVVLKYPKYWTPLDWNNETRHVSKLEFQDEVLFNEFK